MEFTQIKETCLYTTELDRAEKFYKEKLGLSMFAKVEGDHIFFRAGSSVLLIFNPEISSVKTHLPPHDGSGRIHLAFEVERRYYEPYKKEIADKGINILHEEVWPHGHRSFYFHDPDGHVLEILEKGMWEA